MGGDLERRILAVGRVRRWLRRAANKMGTSFSVSIGLSCRRWVDARVPHPVLGFSAPCRCHCLGNHSCKRRKRGGARTLHRPWTGLALFFASGSGRLFWRSLFCQSTERLGFSCWAFVPRWPSSDIGARSDLRKRGRVRAAPECYFTNVAAGQWWLRGVRTCRERRLRAGLRLSRCKCQERVWCRG